MIYIKNGLGCWYTYMLYPGMELTNNIDEQAMRECIILRKIIECFHLEMGGYFLFSSGLLNYNEPQTNTNFACSIRVYLRLTKLINKYNQKIIKSLRE